MKVSSSRTGSQRTPAKPPPPIRIKRRPPPASLVLQDPDQYQGSNPAPTSAPSGAGRIRVGRRTRGRCVDVTRPPWGSPFRIVEADPADLQGRCTVVWAQRGAGALRSSPPGFAPISCVSRREAQELIAILYRDWIADPARSSLLNRARTELRGKLLGCRCGPSTPCHGDVLLDVANQDPPCRGGDL
jgi:hypothetical protein